MPLQTGWGVYAVLAYTLLVAFLMISVLPTYSGKLLGERVPREAVLLVFFAAGAVLALLVTYPFGTLTIGTLLYLGLIPLSIARYHSLQAKETTVDGGEEAAAPVPSQPVAPQGVQPPASGVQAPGVDGAPPTRH